MTTIQLATKLLDTYDPHCAFPTWVFDPVHFDTFHWDSTLVFYPCSANMDVVVRLATEREPVNMTMVRLYDQTKMNTHFGFTTGYYGAYFKKHGKLAPNIAVYVYTPIRLKSTYTHIHLLNLIGLAFDHHDQPDNQYYLSKHISEIYEHYMQMWMYAGICATRLALKRVRVFKVGGGEFSPPNIHFGLCIHHPCLRQLRKLFPNIQFDYDLDFRIPNDLQTYDDFEHTLFINACDPWSIMGNGHNGDTSLDGIWGRISAVAVLSTPLVNKHIQYIPCKLDM